MGRRILSFSFTLYFITLGLSPLWGMHSHDLGNSRVIHSHGIQHSAHAHERTHSSGHDDDVASESGLTQNKQGIALQLEKNRAHKQPFKQPFKQEVPVSLFEYLFGENISLDISTLEQYDIKYLSVDVPVISADFGDFYPVQEYSRNFQSCQRPPEPARRSRSPRAPPRLS